MLYELECEFQSQDDSKLALITVVKGEIPYRLNTGDLITPYEFTTPLTVKDSVWDCKSKTLLIEAKGVVNIVQLEADLLKAKLPYMTQTLPQHN